jgi:hypothetical protein
LLTVDRSVRFVRVVPDPRAAALDGAGTQLVVQAQLERLVFAAQGEPPYALLAGAAQAPAGALPVATLVPDLANERALRPGAARDLDRERSGGAAPPGRTACRTMATLVAVDGASVRDRRSRLHGLAARRVGARAGTRRQPTGRRLIPACGLHATLGRSAGRGAPAASGLDTMPALIQRYRSNSP